MNNLSSQVILASGELCPFSGLRPGMKLIGENNRIFVLESIQRKTKLTYEITPWKGEPFLKGENQYIAAETPDGTALFLKARDYCDRPFQFKEQFALLRAPIELTTAELPIDPYFLGLLLGDGRFCSDTPCLTTGESKIAQYIHSYAKRMKWPVHAYQAPNHSMARALVKAYYFKRPKHGDSLMDHLKTLGLYDRKSSQKFIPRIYLYADRTQREALLAGILDSGSYLNSQTYDLKTSSERLASGVAFLAQSVGLGAFQKPWSSAGKEYKRLTIYGNYKRLPLRVQKASASKIDPLKVAFSIRAVGPQELHYLRVPSFITGDFFLHKGDFLYDVR